MNKTLIVVGIALLLVVGGILYSQSNKTVNQSTDQTTTPTEISKKTIFESTTASPSVSQNVKEFTITGSNFKFDKDQIIVNSGDTVKITFKNMEGMHDWVIDEFNTRTKVLSAGKEETIEFVAAKAGTFEYYCSVGSHRQMGMTGVLTVQ